MQRYLSQMNLPEFVNKQELLFKSKVLAIGAGGLANSCLVYLVGAGVGEIILFDGDIIEESNLNRQVFFTPEDIGQNKALTLAKRLTKLNPDTKLIAIADYFTVKNSNYFSQVDLVLDLSDSHLTKLLINYLSRKYAKAWVHASVLGFDGRVVAFNSQALSDPGYCCLNNGVQTLNTCQTSGVLGAACALVASVQATIALKTLIKDTSHFNRLYVFDLWSLEQKSYKLVQNKSCNYHQNQNLAPEIEYSELITLKNYQLIDIRTFAEWEVEHLKNSQHYLINNILTNYSKLFNSVTDPLIIICNQQTLSNQIAEFLFSKGFSAYALRGGYTKLKKDYSYVKLYSN